MTPTLPKGQTCCGQFAYKRGRADLVRPLARRFEEIFQDAPVVVCPSGSCTAMVRRYPSLFAEDDPFREQAEEVAAEEISRERNRELARMAAEAEAELQLPDLSAPNEDLPPGF